MLWCSVGIPRSYLLLADTYMLSHAFHNDLRSFLACGFACDRAEYGRRAKDVQTDHEARAQNSAFTFPLSSMGIETSLNTIGPVHSGAALHHLLHLIARSKRGKHASRN